MRFLKAVAKTALIALLALAAFELGSTYLYYLETKQLFHSPTLAQQRKTAITAHAPSVTTKLHPYYGFVQIFTEAGERSHGRTTNNYGFAQYKSHYQIPGCCTFPIDPKHRAELFIIGIFGNSIAYAVADQFQAFPSLMDRLKSLPQAHGKKLIVLNVAMGGHHQPQQLHILTNLLAIGMTFDVVLNLSTAQELPGAADNFAHNVSMDYPTSSVWGPMTSLLERQTGASLAGLLSFGLDRSAIRLQQLVNECPVASCLMMLRPTISAMKRLASYFQGPAVGGQQQQQAHFFTARPARAVPVDERYSDAAALWRRSIELMNAATVATGGVFINTLLPNPWDHPSGKEPFLINQRSRESVPPVVRKSLPMMRAVSAEMAQSGFPTFDATRILDASPVDMTTFIDEGGHLGQVGQKAIADFMLDRVEEAFRAKTQAIK